jgi:hypothetical protein
MNLTFPQLLAGSVGALLIYCAIVGKTPVVALKEALSNQQKAAPKPVGPGTTINPVATGQASWGLTTGHSIDPTYRRP